MSEPTAVAAAVRRGRSGERPEIKPTLTARTVAATMAATGRFSMYGTVGASGSAGVTAITGKVRIAGTMAVTGGPTVASLVGIVKSGGLLSAATVAPVVVLSGRTRQSGIVTVTSASGTASVSGTYSPPGDDPLKQALLAFWPLNEASGNALDASGNGHTATLSGTTPPARITDGTAGTVMSFGGAGYLDVGVPIVGTRTRWTMLVRAATTASGAQQGLYRESQASSGSQSGLYFNSSGNIVFGGGGYGATSSLAYNDGNYYTFIGQRETDTVFRLFVNGTKVAEHLFGGDDSGANRTTAAIGAERVFGGTFFNFTGKIQCVAVFDRALTTDEITELGTDPRTRLS